MIPPTVGRVVLFRVRGSDPKGQPLAAQIASVNEDGSINIGYLAPDGSHRSATNIMLHQEGEPYPDTKETHFCEWMPFQKAAAPVMQKLIDESPNRTVVSPRHPGTALDRRAEAIYNSWREENPGEWTPWVPGGNSDKQDEARKMARQALDREARGDFLRDEALDTNREAKKERSLADRLADPMSESDDEAEFDDKDGTVLVEEPTEENTRPDADELHNRGGTPMRFPGDG